MTPEERAREVTIVVEDRGDQHVSRWEVNHEATEVNIAAAIRAAEAAARKDEQDRQVAKWILGDATRYCVESEVAKERERCARVCDDYSAGFEMVNEAEGAAFCPACRSNVRDTAADIAGAIREGKE